MSLQNYILIKYLRTRVKQKLKRETSIVYIRRQLDKAIQAFMPSPSEELEISPVNFDGVQGEWISPSGNHTNRILIYLHGGGYAAGSPMSHRGITCPLASRAGAQVVSLAYRLAPENPFPAAIEDILSTYRWLLNEGLDPMNIALVGDQAGGALVFSTMIEARGAGDPLPAAGVTLSPWLDLTLSGKSIISNAKKDAVSTQEALQIAVDFYIDKAFASNPLASPLFSDLTGLPPILIQVGDTEILLDDSRRMAKALTAAGVKVQLDIWPKVPHMWQLASFDGAFGLPEGKKAVNDITLFLNQTMGE